MSRIRRDNDSRRTTWLFVSVAVGIFLVIFLAARGHLNPVLTNTTVISALAPFQRAISWAGDKVNGAVTTVWDIAAVYYQNNELKEEVIALRQQNLQAAEYVSENIRLREMLNYKQSAVQFDLMPAKVIGRESSTWTSVISINRGSSDGITANMPVVTEKGLVGVVTEVSPHASRVQLILDPRSSVGTLVQRAESRVAGIVQGNPSDAVLPQMINIPRNSDIVEGDTIVTSGFGGVYPKGLMVGSVAEVKNDSGGLLEIAYIYTAVDFQKLEDVMIITASREAPPQPLTPPKQTPGTETDKDGKPIGEGGK
ncbi:MAG: rod shape-determining protein MreC [Anaerovibrio sp.]|uniref:rod shape-determining protein MreC n=1 Tax=Anaerovibrio sp. TaxID=1872532 RepID=UPI0025B956D5|nr:rod shape-determining protein MreC [Anaerovibrio sp.]MBE6100071.1 rod shape-determining protein MreC [Anaerovibrio sp.]MBQ3854415.1 rod shape-determining protein MreC [Anaerovibrio sp.]